MTIEKLSETHYKINKELCHAISRLGGGPGLLCILGSWGDTLPEPEILIMIEDYNKLSEKNKLKSS